MMTFVRTSSHRSRDRLKWVLGRCPRYWYTYEHGGVFAEVDEGEMATALGIKGITRTRIKPVAPCFKWVTSSGASNEKYDGSTR